VDSVTIDQTHPLWGAFLASQRLASDQTAPKVMDPAALYAIALPLLYPTDGPLGSDVERLVVIALDRKHRVIDAVALTQGNGSFCIVDPAQCLRWALTRDRPVAAWALAHNHPSGDPTPSHQDREVTQRAATAGRAVGLPLIDHVVVVPGGYTSLAEQGCV